MGFSCIIEIHLVDLVEIVKDFFFQAEDGIRDLVRSRGLGDVYKRQYQACTEAFMAFMAFNQFFRPCNVFQC